jgi:pimeloyl-ACP methyl ester carboxylesterase
VAIPPAHAEAIAAAVPRSSVIRVPDAAHLVNVDRPEVVADGLVRHLADELTADRWT